MSTNPRVLVVCIPTKYASCLILHHGIVSKFSHLRLRPIHQSEMSRTPSTPFIPPLPLIPDSSPEPRHPPVIPTGNPIWNPPFATGRGYAPFASPYFTGYPQDLDGVPPKLSPDQQAFYSQYSLHSGSHPNSPQYTQSAPAVYKSFRTRKSNATQHPSTPWPFAPWSSFDNYDPEELDPFTEGKSCTSTCFSCCSLFKDVILIRRRRP